MYNHYNPITNWFYELVPTSPQGQLTDGSPAYPKVSPHRQGHPIFADWEDKDSCWKGLSKTHIITSHIRPAMNTDSPSKKNMLGGLGGVGHRLTCRSLPKAVEALKSRRRKGQTRPLRPFPRPKDCLCFIFLNMSLKNLHQLQVSLRISQRDIITCWGLLDHLLVI